MSLDAIQKYTSFYRPVHATGHKMLVDGHDPDDLSVASEIRLKAQYLHVALHLPRRMDAWQRHMGKLL
jgi:hypothetical protein